MLVRCPGAGASKHWRETQLLSPAEPFGGAMTPEAELIRALAEDLALEILAFYTYGPT